MSCVPNEFFPRNRSVYSYAKQKYGSCLSNIFSQSDENFKITGDLLQFGGTIIIDGGCYKVSTCVGVVA